MAVLCGGRCDVAFFLNRVTLRYIRLEPEGAGTGGTAGGDGSWGPFGGDVGFRLPLDAGKAGRTIVALFDDGRIDGLFAVRIWGQVPASTTQS